MSQDTINAIYFSAGGLSTGIPMLFLWLGACRTAKDWKYLAEQMDHQVERAQHSFNSMYCQYLQLLAFFHAQDGDKDESDWWKN